MNEECTKRGKTQMARRTWENYVSVFQFLAATYCYFYVYALRRFLLYFRRRYLYLFFTHTLHPKVFTAWYCVSYNNIL